MQTLNTDVIYDVRDGPGALIAPLTLPYDQNAVATPFCSFAGNLCRVITRHGTSASGPIHEHTIHGIPFLIVGTHPDEAMFALADVAEIRPMSDENQTFENIADVVAMVFKVTRDEILSGRKPALYTEPRFALWYAARILKAGSLSELGHLTGKRKHGTIMHGITRARALMETDWRFKAKVDRVLAHFNSATT